MKTQGCSLFLPGMKILSPYISSLLGLLLIAATLLPSMHAFAHDQDFQNSSNPEKVVNITQSSIDCDLCDYHFSSIDTPIYFKYNLDLPLKESVFSISIAQTVFLYTKNNFSLRAPPAVIA